MNASPTRRQIIGSALALLGVGVVTRWGSNAGASPPAGVHGAASATATAVRVAAPGILTFPIELPADLILLDNFGGASLGGGMHQGIDIGRRDQRPGHPLVACVDAVIAEQRILEGRQGNAWVLVDAAGDGYRYHHLDEFAPGLQVGDRVQRGQVIGTMGSSGNPVSPHLHFEVRRGGANGTPVDPVPLLGLPRAGVTVI
jgi:murein DD-endopeptidase MepM/ murein hydrolase activator NlpD